MCSLILLMSRCIFCLAKIIGSDFEVYMYSVSPTFHSRVKNNVLHTFKHTHFHVSCWCHNCQCLGFHCTICMKARCIVYSNLRLEPFFLFTRMYAHIHLFAVMCQITFNILMSFCCKSTIFSFWYYNNSNLCQSKD